MPRGWCTQKFPEPLIHSLFTSARPLTQQGTVRKSRTASVFYAVRDPKIRLQHLKPINEGWSVALPYQNSGSLNQATHGASVMLSGNRSILAGERSIQIGSAVGTSYMLDLFELYQAAYARYDVSAGRPTNETRIIVRPLDAANTDSTWESQPTVSNEGSTNEPTFGKTLFFVSNRPESENDTTDDMNIWFMQRTISGQWSKPKIVPGINTPGDDISPHCGADGKFYYSTNWDFATQSIGTRGQDIYRCSYRDSAGVLLPILPVNLDVALAQDVKRFQEGIHSQKVKNLPRSSLDKPIVINSEADDCFPYITADGRHIFLTSNRKGSQELDLYAFSLPKPRIRLRVNVREIETNEQGKPISEPRLLEGVSVAVRNTQTNTVFKLASATDECFLEPDRTYRLTLDILLKEHCYTNSLKGDEVLSLTTTLPRDGDTLYVREFTILKQQKPIPTLEFVPTGALAFFITGYWKPTTTQNLREFRLRHKADFFKNSIFVDSTDLKTADADSKNKRLASAAPTTYRNYDDIAMAIDTQFEREFGRLAEALEKIEPLRFWEERVSCGRDTIYLKLTVRGYTDRRGLRDGYYGDVPVAGKDRTGKLVQIPTGDRIMRQMPALPDSGQRGNVKLSILRARFMAEAFHQFMLRRDSARNIYRYLAENNRILPPDIIGMGFDKERFQQTGEENDLYSRRIEMNFELVRRAASHSFTPNLTTVPSVSASATPASTTVSGSISSISAKDSTQHGSPISVASNSNVHALVPLSPSSLTNPLLSETSAAFPITVLSPGDSSTLPRSTPFPLHNKEAERCYTILYTSLEGNKAEAIKLKDILLTRGVGDARVDVYINPIGKRFYRVCSGCFQHDYEAFDYLKTLPSMREILNLSAKPVVIRM